MKLLEVAFNNEQVNVKIYKVINYNERGRCCDYVVRDNHIKSLTHITKYHPVTRFDKEASAGIILLVCKEEYVNNYLIDIADYIEAYCRIANIEIGDNCKNFKERVKSLEYDNSKITNTSDDKVSIEESGNLDTGKFNQSEIEFIKTLINEKVDFYNKELSRVTKDSDKFYCDDIPIEDSEASELLYHTIEKRNECNSILEKLDS